MQAEENGSHTIMPKPLTLQSNIQPLTLYTNKRGVQVRVVRMGGAMKYIKYVRERETKQRKVQCAVFDMIYNHAPLSLWLMVSAVHAIQNVLFMHLSKGIFKQHQSQECGRLCCFNANLRIRILSMHNVEEVR